MAWTIYGKVFETSDASDNTIHQKFQFLQNKKQIIAVMRSWVIMYNQPTFTNMRMKIYTSANDMPDFLITTSTNVWTNSTIVNPADLGVAAEMYFEIDGTAFQSGEFYHAVINTDGYTNGASHVSWKTTFPDPPYKTGVTIDYNNLLRYPLDLTFVGSELK